MSDQSIEIPEEWRSFTPEQRAILECFPRSPSLTAAAHQIGLHRDTVYGWAERLPEFADALRLAKEQHADNLEAELYRRAMAGTGQMPDTLGIFLLKGYRPMFRERYSVDVSGTVTVQHQLSDMSAEDRLALLQLAIMEEHPTIDVEVRELPPG